MCTVNGVKKEIMCRTTSVAGISCETCCDVHHSLQVGNDGNVNLEIREIKNVINTTK